MTNDCSNIAVREMLPDFMHGSLGSADADLVGRHLATCETCSAELALLRRVVSAFPAPVVDVARIAGAVPAYRRRTRFASPTLMRLAAGIALVALGGASYSIVRETIIGSHMPDSSYVVALGDSSVPALSPAVDPLVVTDQLEQLDDESLVQLLAELEQLGAGIPEEPRRMVPTIGASGELQ